MNEEFNANEMRKKSNEKKCLIDTKMMMSEIKHTADFNGTNIRFKVESDEQINQIKEFFEPKGFLIEVEATQDNERGRVNIIWS